MLQYPTISYLEARNQYTGEIIDKLYIGDCTYDTDKFNLGQFTDYISHNVLSDLSANKNYDTLVSCIEFQKYHISKIKQTIQELEPETMDEENALYDMKLVLYWTNEQLAQQKHIKFIFVTYQAILENMEY